MIDRANAGETSGITDLRRKFCFDRYQSGTMKALFSHIRCIDLLASRNDVDPERIGVLGHSLGGLYMQLFARAHPDEVKGLVLVDAVYPREIKRTEDFPWATRLAGRLLFSRTVWQEVEQIDATGEAVLALPAIDDMPIVRLVNRPRPHPGEMPPIAVDFGVGRTDRATFDLVRNLYPKAQTVVADSDHQMPTATPDVVIDAIRDVLKTLAAPRTASR